MQRASAVIYEGNEFLTVSVEVEIWNYFKVAV